MSKVPHTRIFDELIPEFGLVGASVYGVVWRHCQMRDGACHATYETLGAEIGLDKGTVYRYVKKLQDAQWIAAIHYKDNSPNWLILAEKQVGTETTQKDEQIGRETRQVVRETTSKGEQVVRETTEDTKDLKKPDKKPKKATPSRERAGPPFWNDDLEILADHFAEVSNIAIPKRETRSDYAAATKSWKMPLSDMFELVGSVTETKHLIALTIQEMRADKLTIYAPRSIWKVAVSIHAREPTNGPEPASYQAIRKGLGLLGAGDE